MARRNEFFQGITLCLAKFLSYWFNITGQKQNTNTDWKFAKYEREPQGWSTSL